MTVTTTYEMAIEVPKPSKLEKFNVDMLNSKSKQLYPTWIDSKEME
jgi:hypothetical protein